MKKNEAKKKPSNGRVLRCSSIHDPADDPEKEQIMKSIREHRINSSDQLDRALGKLGAAAMFRRVQNRHRKK